MATASVNVGTKVLFSADSHVMEPVDLWKNGVPVTMRADAPVFPPHKVGEGFQSQSGGWDPHERQKEMAQDNVSAEVLYPTLGLGLFALDDPKMQEACFEVYNDWIADYCAVAPDRLLGVGMIATHDIKTAVAELERSHKAGLRGALVWQTPRPDLPFQERALRSAVGGRWGVGHAREPPHPYRPRLQQRAVRTDRPRREAGGHR